LAAAVLWAGSISIYRFWGKGVPPHTLNLLKSTVAALFLGASLLVVRPPAPAEARTWVALALSGFIGLALGDTAFFAALKRLGAHATSSVFCMSPPLAALLAVFYLGEKLSLKETVGMVCTVGAIGGVLYFGRRNTTFLSELPGKTLAVGALYALTASLANALGLVIAREAFQKADVLWGTFLRMGTAAVALVGMRHLDRPQPALRSVFTGRKQVAALIFAAFSGTYLGVLLLSVGTKYAKAGLTSALSSTFPLWIIPIARIYLKEQVDLRSAGCTLLALAGIFLMVVPEPVLIQTLAALRRLIV